MSMPYLHLDRTSRVSLAEQIAEQLVRAIRARHLKAGQSLPTVRRLASSLDVSLETAQKAYHLLRQDGWIQSRPRHGTIVNPALPDSLLMLSPKREEERTPFLERMKESRSQTGLIPVSGISLPPVNEEFMRAWKQVAGEAVMQAFAWKEVDPFGLPQLRSRIQGLLAARGCWTEETDICIVNGTQQALWLLADQLIQPGDVVVVPEMCYLPARDVFSDRGARILPISLGEEGIDAAELEAICHRERVKIVYAMPNAHYPTGVSWSDDTKRSVLELAARFGFFIIEDEYFSELYYTSLPPLTLFNLAQEQGASVFVFYMSSFSTIVHPNLRLGYMVIPSAYRERLRQVKHLLDGTTAVISQQLFLQVWDKINFPHYMEKLRIMLREARDAAMDSLRRWLPTEYRFQTPVMGVCTWVYAPADFDSLRFFDSCVARGVYVRPGNVFSVEDPVPGFQVKFGTVAAAVLNEGVRRIGEVLMLDMKK
jgi:DNA-binding transcriptional MocR family regulator